jgi:uncharacterized membrane protein YphA (DoxX/SURF4 family)
MDANIVFTLARFLTCGIWVGAGLYKLFHFHETLEDMAANGVPLPRLAFWPVVAVELIGSVLIGTNTQVWAVALAWIGFILVATPLYHFRMYTPDGRLVFPQLVQTTKNVTIIGGLLALILLDPSTPAWLVVRRPL